MASIISNRFFYNLIAGLLDLDTDTFKMAILNNTHSQDKDDDVWSDISANEVSGSNYTAGGETITTPAISQDDTNDKAVWDCDDVPWTNVTFTSGRYACVYDTTVADTICAIYDFGADKSPSGDDFTVQINTDGLLSLAQA